jgi:hypothetical protein
VKLRHGAVSSLGRGPNRRFGQCGRLRREGRRM